MKGDSLISTYRVLPRVSLDYSTKTFGVGLFCELRSMSLLY
jgi:hypothetical protein